MQCEGGQDRWIFSHKGVGIVSCWEACDWCLNTCILALLDHERLISDFNSTWGFPGFLRRSNVGTSEEGLKMTVLRGGEASDTCNFDRGGRKKEKIR
jgi:hypothetical protein